jgi:hypothetical protein
MYLIIDFTKFSITTKINTTSPMRRRLAIAWIVYNGSGIIFRI